MIDWNKIREAHAPMVWRTVFRILKHYDDTLDCCQDVFAEAVTRAPREPVKDWGALLRWLAARRAIDCLRRRNRASAVAANVEDFRGRSNSAEQQVAFNELMECIRGELAKLPDKQAEAFWLVCIEERTYEEVAQLTGASSNAVGVLVHRARQHMKVKLNALNPVQKD